jgi:phosphate uptake regulator
MTKYIPIRKFGMYSLYVRLPAEFVRANGLSPGDLVLLEPEKLKIVKQADLVAAPVKEMAAAEEAAE